VAEESTTATEKSLDDKLTEDEQTAFYENVSDRSSALVLANIVENRLTELLRLSMRDDKMLADELFNPSGPLGPFGTKIRLAYMVSLLSREAYNDLMIVSRIRNKFAHDLSVTAFSNQQIHDWIKNMHMYDIVKRMAEAGTAKVEAHAEGTPRHTTLDYVASGFLDTPERAYRNCLRFIIHQIIDFEEATRARRAAASPTT
jgi:DNA-binding MltR family transcriptional regulator